MSCRGNFCGDLPQKPTLRETFMVIYPFTTETNVVLRKLHCEGIKGVSNSNTAPVRNHMINEFSQHYCYFRLFDLQGFRANVARVDEKISICTLHGDHAAF